ncbi:hypothetical protein F5Y17DRAFT_453381 [Xylariaceae sp. FL0594]|nr:hypothetical protein F5Y17DRAFT_453381 [Xylariaceae sp. FL0594]
MQDFYIQSITWDLEYNPDSDITLYVHHNGAVFRICYIAQKLANSPSILEQHHKSYEILYNDDPEGESPAELLKSPFKELMTHLAPNPFTELTKSLHGYFYPPSFILEATVAENSVQPHLKAALSRQEFVRPGEYVDNKFIQRHLPSLESKLNTYSSRQVQVLAHTSRLVPSVVCVDGATYFFKPWISGRVHGYHELRSYGKILAADEASPPLLCNAHICRLHGLIIDNDDDVLQHYHLDSNEKDYPGRRLVGLLLTYIENKGTMKDLAPWSDCTIEDRARWSRQICDSIRHLHAADVVWGDAKPENVLIDIDGNAYLIDFGGSYTQDWVDEENQETVEGDLQGMERIEEWLVKWSNKPVTRVKQEKSL